jgi:hypothetical protein
MSKKSTNVLVKDENLTKFFKHTKSIISAEKSTESANRLFCAWAIALYPNVKADKVYLNFTNPNTKKSNLSKDEYNIVKDTIAKAKYNATDFKLYNCADITQTYGFKKKTASYKAKANLKRKLQQQPASRCNKLVQTLEKAQSKKTKGGSRQGSKYDQIDKLFATLVTKLNANATDKSIKWLNNNDLESIKKHITNARACISKA